MPRKPKPQDGPLPAGKGRGTALGKLYAPLEGLAGAKLMAARMQVLNTRQNHPDAVAAEVLEKHLTAAHLHPALAESPELSQFVFLMRELLAEHVPGMTLEHMLQPLQTLLARRGGGRPSREQTHSRWASQFDEVRAKWRTLTAREIYDDIAAEEAERTGASVPWTRIRDGVSAARKAASKR